MATTTWKVDPMHSEVLFKIKHLMITTVTGSFGSYTLDVETEEDDFTKASKIEFSADIASINTNNEQRDGHLKSADFFDAGTYPKMTFVGKTFEPKGDDYLLHGDLTIRDVTKPFTFNVEMGGTAVDFYGQTKAGFTVTGKLSRKEFGLTWSGVTEAGNVVLGDEVKLQGEFQLVKQVAA
jgi:polyisoprenoid-binding protein YceI